MKDIATECVITWRGAVCSANDRVKPGGIRFYNSPKYAAFKKSLYYTLAAERIRSGWETTREEVAVTLELQIPARMDIDNVVKPCLDALQLAGFVENDRQVARVTVSRGMPATGESVIKFVISMA